MAKLTKEQLQTFCSWMNVSKKGNKKELIARIVKELSHQQRGGGTPDTDIVELPNGEYNITFAANNLFKTDVSNSGALRATTYQKGELTIGNTVTIKFADGNIKNVGITNVTKNHDGTYKGIINGDQYNNVTITPKQSGIVWRRT